MLPQIIVTNMKNNILKILIILTHLIIIIPTPHIYLPNFIIFFITITQDFYSLVEGSNFPFFSIETYYPFLIIISVILLFRKNIKGNIVGVLILLTVTLIESKLVYFKNIYFLSTFLLHLIAVVYYFAKTFYKNKKVV